MQQHTGMTMKGQEGEPGQGQKKAMVDLEGHGAVFGSPGIGQGESFSYEVDHMLEGMTIAYHNHAEPPGDRVDHRQTRTRICRIRWR